MDANTTQTVIQDVNYGEFVTDEDGLTLTFKSADAAEAWLASEAGQAAVGDAEVQVVEDVAVCDCGAGDDSFLHEPTCSRVQD